MFTTLIVSRSRTKGAWRRQLAGPTFSMAAHAVVFYAAAMATMPVGTGESLVANDTSLIYVRPQERKNPTRLFIESVVDEPPVRISFPPPEYPRMLLEARIEGSVVLEAVIDTLGHPEPVSIRVVSSTNRAFESAARDALRRALFRAGRVQGQRVRVLVRQPLRFQLPK